MRLRLPYLFTSLLVTTSCATSHFFQPDARLSPGSAPADSATVTAGRHYQRGPIGRFLLGKHYRRVWAEPVALPVLDLTTAVPGGLKPGKVGGGFQTISMTVEGADGRTYALRSVDKDPSKTLPKPLQPTLIMTVVRDATSAAMPYGALVVPPLAQAAGVYHTNPRLFYVRPDEQGLGPTSERLRGKVVLLEEKLEGKANIYGLLAGAQDLEESEDVLAERYASPKSVLDEAAFLRARLLDVWLGDWDRHEGQWSWAAFKQADGRTTWRPIPQDRDQVFFRFDDGILSWVVSKAVAKFRTFGPKFQSIEGYTRNAQFIDERALSGQTHQQYQATALDLQRRLTDAVIDSAVRRLPRAVYRLEGARLAASLRARRATLPNAAAELYRLKARRVVVAGTDEAERFVVERRTDSTTVVTVYPLEGKKAEQPLYQRTFHPRETHTIVLHGLQGKDRFELSGTVRSSPFVDIYGGPDDDTVEDNSHVAGLRRKTRFFDTHRNNTISPGKETKNRTAHSVAPHAFDRDGSGR
ncbi:hypothetical protein HER32_00100 [Hymenobacter sp. BT18]|uniref:hypothetical protein n=1 Tax=Hymenobacter sp. BT18 TaxID=2835648 RepID=UPI00143E79AF|nr:hypothetical protein [Hymenobacter sp. BT18]QIX59678.1 hypothetical protein HER32_00100 [Hymenobacter sp. BT18]